MEAKQMKLANGMADAFGMVQQPGGFYAPSMTPTVNRQDTVINALRGDLISNNRVALSQAYAEIGLVETIVDVPVDDGFRGGFDVKASELDEGDIEELRLYMESKNDLQTMTQTCKWDRLFGAAATIILDGNDLDQPFDLNAIQQGTDDIDFLAADLWELQSSRSLHDEHEQVQRVRLVTQDLNYFTYYGQRVHKSRVMLIKGKQAPSFIRARLRGWGTSVVETLVRSLNQYLKATDLSFEVLDEFKVDVYKLKDMVGSLASDAGTEAVLRRVTLANSQKNYNTAIVLDADDDYQAKQVSFSGLAEAQAGIRDQVASDVRIPQTKLFGQSSQGLNSSGEDEIENYNAMIESTIRARYKFHALKIHRVRCMELFGFVPDDLSIHFKSLRMLRAVDEETVKTQKFQRVLQARAANEITSLEFRDAVNRGNLLDIRLETDPATMAEIEREAAVAPQGETEGDSKDGDKDEEKQDEEGKRVLNSRAEDTLFNRIFKRISNAFAPQNRVKNNPGLDQPTTTLSKRKAKRLKAKYFKVKDALPAAFNEDDKRLRLKNSTAFDLASYEADGGDDWIDTGKGHFYEDIPTGANPALWERARDRSIAVFGSLNWKFQLWFYRKQGGSFA